MRFRLLSAFVAFLAAQAPLAETIASSSATASAQASVSGEDVAAVRSLVESINRAITERNLEQLLDTFADGAVRVDAFPAHRFGAAASGDDEKVEAVDLERRWRTVAPILFSTTRSYERRIQDMDVHVDRDLAVAWVAIETAMSPVGEETMIGRNAFKEIYLLRRYDDGWKIVALTNNRRDAEQ